MYNAKLTLAENVFKIYLAELNNGNFVIGKTQSWAHARAKLGDTAVKIRIRHTSDRSINAMQKDSELIKMMIDGECGVARIETKDGNIVVAL